MPITQPDLLPDPPLRDGTQDPDQFRTAASNLLEALPPMVEQFNTALAQIVTLVSGVDFNATSTTSLTIGTGTKNLTVETGKLYNTGQFVSIARTSAPANVMYGQVTSYNSGTGALVVSVTSTAGSGTFTDWSVAMAAVSGGTWGSIAGTLSAQTDLQTALDARLSKSGGTMTGALALATAASGLESIIIPHGAAPSAPTNGSVWTTTSGLFIRLNGTTYQLATLAGAQTFSDKTLSAPTFTGSIYSNGAARGAVTAVGAVDLDCSTANHFTKTINGNTTFTFSNIPAGLFIWSLQLTHTSGTITLPAACIWEDGTTPTFTTGKTHLFVFQTSNSGTTVRVSVRKNYAS